MKDQFQLNLFEQDFTKDNNVLQRANELIDLLNDGYKEKERYWAKGYMRYNEYYIFIAAQNNGNHVFNILNSDGNIPDGFVVNWRIWPCIQHDLKITKQ